METKNLAPKKVLVAKTTTNLKNISKHTEPIVHAMMAESEKAGITAIGPMEYIYFGASEDMDKEFQLEIALPVSDDSTTDNPQFEIKETNPLKYVAAKHVGSIDTIMKTYDELFGQIMAGGLQPTEEIREVYEKWIDLSSKENITEIQVGIN